MPAKKAAKPRDIDVVKEDLAALQEQVNALAARLAYMETFRPAIEVVRDEPRRTWTEWWQRGR